MYMCMYMSVITQANAKEIFEFWQRQIPPPGPFVSPHPSLQVMPRNSVMLKFILLHFNLSFIS